MAEWARLANSTISNYLKGYEAAVFRDRAMLALMKSKGQVEMNCSGVSITGQVEYRQTPIQQNTQDEVLTFAKQDYLKQWSFVPKGYVATDAISDRELDMNKGGPALVNLVANMQKRLFESLDQQFPDKLFNDANTNTSDIDGLETMFGTPTNTVTFGTAGAVSHAAAAADVIAIPNVTNYGGLSTVLGTYGGSAPTTGNGWPDGPVSQGAYDFWSPLIGNTTTTGLGASAANWAQNCEFLLGYLITHAQRNKTKKGEIDLVLLDRDLFRQLKDKIRSYQRAEVDTNLRMRALGFNSISVDGVEVLHDYSVPGGVGYGINADFMSLKSWKKTAFEAKGPFYDEGSQSTRFMVRFFGNLVCDSPRNFFKLAALA